MVGTVASGELAATRVAAAIVPAVPVRGQCPPSTFASLDPPPAWETSSSRTQAENDWRAGDFAMGKPGTCSQDYTNMLNCCHVNSTVELELILMRTKASTGNHHHR